MEKQQMREKLAELLQEISYDQKLAWYDLWDMRDGAEDIADLLIANGVTVQDEPIKIVFQEVVDEKRLIEMLHNAPLQIFPCEPVQEWISVKDRLPKEDEDIIAFCYYHESWQAQVCHLSSNYKGQWYTSVAGQWVRVTHWMPLPEPPKGE